MAVATKTKKEESLLETVKTILYVVVTVILIRTLVFEPFNIPSGSMIPTLLVGDYVFVAKYSYGYSKWSLPFWHPDVAGRLFGSLPKRGDVAVFRLPRDPSVNYIKRIIGLPGDKIQVTDGQLYVNGDAVPREQVADFLAEYEPPDAQGGDWEPGNFEPTRQFIETLPGGVVHPILQRDRIGQLDNTPVFDVPPGNVFAMGDNRTNSADSRVPVRDNGVGYIPVENLVGRAEFRFFSIDTTQDQWWKFWLWPFEIRYSRLFTAVH